MTKVEGWPAATIADELLPAFRPSLARAEEVSAHVGATGGRILANLTHELQRRGGRYGLETMCIGGGQGIVAIFEAA